MPESHLRNPPEMQKLLMKYGGRNVPPLIASNDGKDEGLLGGELLEIFRKGFSATYAIPLWISADDTFPARPDSRDMSRRKLSKLLEYCQYFQQLQKYHKEAKKLGNGECCPARHKPIMQNGEATAFMCYMGLISAIAPVQVAGETVAILSAECRKPREGTIWPKIFNCQSPAGRTQSPERKTDLWRESKRGVQECEKILGLEHSELLAALTTSVEENSEVEISPESFETMMTGLANASKHLADLAGKTYRLEKESVVNWLRAEMASALSSVDTFWDTVRWCFGNLAQLVGVDYVLLISQSKSRLGSLDLQCQYGLAPESLPALRYDWAGAATHVDGFVGKIRKSEERVQEIDLRQHRDMPILSTLYCLYGKGVDYPVLVAPATTLNGRLTCLVLGKREPTARQQTVVPNGNQGNNSDASATGVKWLREDDHQYLMTIAQELAIITNVFFSMNKLQETVKAQTNFMESVAHDLKTPIQNIMVAAENLREGRIAPERTSRTITGVVTQLQRLNLLAQKTWTLEQIRLDKLVYNDEQAVNPYLIFTQCKEILTDLAERGSIHIRVDPSVKNWQPIKVDAEMFRLVVLNLIHNGIKYSFPNTRIGIGGWQDSAGVAMTFENEGIPIHDEEKDRIFERYFRTKNAVKMDPAGSGVGLALVEDFMDHYKGRIQIRSAEVGFGRYLNVFSLFLPRR